jgi:hypothetical protein
MRRFKEAFEFRDPEGKLFNPQKQQWYGKEREMEKLFPDSEQGAKQRHMEKITKESYLEAVKKLQHYTGMTPNTASMFSMFGAVTQAINTVKQKQEPHRQHLEQLAVKIVLELPEFKMFNDIIKSGALKLDVKISKPQLKKTEPKESEDEDEAGGGEIEVDEIMADELADLDDRLLRRQFGRMMTQGNAVNKLYLYQLANDELNKMDPELIKLYGVLSSIVHITYYSLPALIGGGGEGEEEDDNFRDMAEEAAVGSVEIIPNEDGTYTLKARSPFFPYLVHEFVKGLYEYLSMDIATDEQLAGETLAQEFIEIMSGPQLYKNFSVMIPSNKQHLMPLAYKMLLREPKENIKAVVAGNERGKSVINNLLQKAQATMDEFENPPYEEPEYGEGEPEEPEQFQ